MTERNEDDDSIRNFHVLCTKITIQNISESATRYHQPKRPAQAYSAYDKLNPIALFGPIPGQGNPITRLALQDKPPNQSRQTQLLNVENPLLYHWTKFGIPSSRDVETPVP